MSNKQIATPLAPAAIGPYSQGISTGNLVFISGQLPIDIATGKLLEGSIAEQTTLIMKNIKIIAEEAGTSLDSIVKTTIFLTDLSNFQEVNAAYGAFFSNTPPARATVQVAALPLGASVEIEAIATVG
ncbi:MAG: RidA family protein [Desulfocapsaceae bacterium]|jgi:2-iminobutanoate/2-iminopropanoate deaminase|nr:RidA family protein [Desulfocapsaceae bacterium]